MTTGLLITTAGQAAMAADLGGGTDLVLTHVAFGDSNGVPYVPNSAQTALVNERYRSTIASVAVVAGSIVVDAIIPADTPDGSARPSHGFNVAEAGLYSASGTLIGVARMGNGYKPPPDSGQAAVATFRFKLAISNPSAISVVIDPQAQLMLGRHVRVPWLTVDGVLNAPPGAPNQGDTYIIGAAPTGAWTGFAHRIAQWIGVWSLATAPIGHHVVDNSKNIDAGSRWLERTADGWMIGLTRLLQKQPGNYQLAAGTANALTASLDPAPTALGAIVGVPIRLKIASANTGAATLDLNGLGAAAVVSYRGTPLKSGDLRPGAIASLVYDGAAFRFAGLAISDLPLTGGTFATSSYGPGNFTVPAGVTRIKVRIWGAGGGGGGSNGGAAGGGCGGGYAEGLYAVTPGQVIPYVVGQGGSGGAGGTNGTAGGSSSLGSLISATGGDPGAGDAGGGGTGATGNGAGGTILNLSGFGGAAGFGSGGLLFGGAGGGAFGTVNTNQVVSAANAGGYGGAAPGGGGSGSVGPSQYGGAGAHGALIIEY